MESFAAFCEQLLICFRGDGFINDSLFMVVDRGDISIRNISPRVIVMFQGYIDVCITIEFLGRGERLSFGFVLNDGVVWNPSLLCNLWRRPFPE